MHGAGIPGAAPSFGFTERDPAIRDSLHAKMWRMVGRSGKTDGRCPGGRTAALPEPSPAPARRARTAPPAPDAGRQMTDRPSSAGQEPAAPAGEGWQGRAPYDRATSARALLVIPTYNEVENIDAVLDAVAG